MYPRLWYYKEVFNGTLTAAEEFSDVFDLNTLKEKITYKPYAGLNDANLGAEVVGIILTISDVSGTNPTLAVEVQGSEDGTNWTSLASGDLGPYFEAGIFTTTLTINGGIFPSRYLRLKFTLGGMTPSFTFTAGIKVMV
jgi:hypothetical protein